jgi:hypothetical protein
VTVAKDQPSSAEKSIARLRERIDTLVATRQEMRARGASLAELESNRLELSSRQRQLSCAFLERVLPGSSACGAQHEPKRLLRSRPVLAHERLAA